MITFPVDDVTPVPARLPERALRERVGPCAALGGDPELPTVDIGGGNPLMMAVHLAFSEHRPLVLSPDAIWLAIASGFALHVRLNAERLRHRLVRHEGKKTLTLRFEGRSEDHGDRSAWIRSFSEMLAKEVGAGWGRTFACDFTTSDALDRIAGDIVFLDAFSPYYDYFAMGICGIPEITLTGTPEDWRKIRERVDVLAEFDLQWWAGSLRPILDQFVRAAEGCPDRSFWQEIYKPIQLYGPERITGWIGRIFPYLSQEGRYDRINPMLAIAHDALMRRPPPEGPGSFLPESVTTADVPPGVSSVRIDVEEEGRPPATLLAEGGLLCVVQDAEGRLIPRSGFVLREPDDCARMARIVEDIQKNHRFTPPDPAEKTAGGGPWALFFDHVREAALFGETWRIPPSQEWRRAQVSSASVPPFEAWEFAEIPGAGLWTSRHGVLRVASGVLVEDPANEAWRAGIEEEFEVGLLTPAEYRARINEVPLIGALPDPLPVVGRSPLDLLEEALANGGKIL